jgi:thiamine biosynthesis lipoprotein
VRLAEFVLSNQALGTSGSGTQFFHHQGKRYGHILDPRTGWPAEQVLSATVIAPTAEQADALSTALYVLGLEGARRFCEKHPSISALLVTPAQRAGGIELFPVNLPDDRWRRV